MIFKEWFCVLVILFQKFVFGFFLFRINSKNLVVFLFRIRSIFDFYKFLLFFIQHLLK